MFILFHTCTPCGPLFTLDTSILFVTLNCFLGYRASDSNGPKFYIPPFS